MRRRTTLPLFVCVAFLAGPAAGADDAKKPTGSWARTAGDNKITFDIKADSLRFTLTNGSSTLEIDADYGVTKDGTLFGIITKTERKGIDGGPDKGSLFSFRFKMDKDTLTITDLGGSGNAEAKQLIQGEYKKAGK